MAIILPLGRAVTRHIPKSNHALTRLALSNPLLHASSCPQDHQRTVIASPTVSFPRLFSQIVPRWADGPASKPRARPRAQTKKSTAAKKTPAKGKPGATKKKAAAKKPKAKLVKKPKAKKALSKSAIDRARRTRSAKLRTSALLTEPKQLPANAWLVFATTNRPPHVAFADNAQVMKDLGQKFKRLSPEEHEQLNHTANQNKAKNQSEYKKWVESHNPADIKEANNARRLLHKEKKVKAGKTRSQLHLIKDDRVVKLPRNPFTFFLSDRFASGDFHNMAIAECSRLAGREWKGLSASEKKPYLDKAAADLARYHEEHKTVYGTEVPTKLKTSA